MFIINSIFMEIFYGTSLNFLINTIAQTKTQIDTNTE